MQTKTISNEDYLKLVQTEESHFYELKSNSVKGKAIQKAVVAFANSDGGELIVGIADSKENIKIENRWQGFQKIESLNGFLQAIFDIQPSLDIRYEFLKHEDKPGYVLRVIVEKSSQIHKTPDNGIFIRHGAQSIPLKDHEKISQLSYAKGSTTYEDQKIEDLPTEQIVESEILFYFLADFAPKTDPLEFVLNQNLIDLKSWIPRVASVLLFHPLPSTIIPKKCAVKITRYKTKEDDPERDHLDLQKTIEGSCYRLIKDTVKGVKEIMSSSKIWTTEGLKELEYPPEAIWEVIVNAIIHRDYSISDDIQILIFDNRIEILSPGRLPGYVTKENILESRYSRNPKLVRTLNRYKDAPNKDLGEGLNTTFQKMKDWGLKPPKIYEENNYVKVILPHEPLAAPAETILKFLNSHETITNGQARELTGIRSENQIKTEFYKLRDKGMIERVPELGGAKSAWRLVKN